VLHNAAGITAKTVSALTQDNFSAPSNMTDTIRFPAQLQIKTLVPRKFRHDEKL
jgi:hypothetical protein